jgi:spermidine/putrescine transport system ATP-binding protein
VDIYNEPKNAFVARFIGESNIIDGIMHEDYIVEFSGRVFECVDKDFEREEAVDVVIRPEDMEIVNSDDGIIKGMVTSVIFKGVHYEMMLKDGDIEWKIHSTIMKEVGTKVGINIKPENIHIMKKVNAQ